MQIRVLRELGYRIVRLEDLTTSVDTSTGYAVITFDDGYADNWCGFQWLASQGLAATWFVVTGRLGQRAVWDGDAGYARLLLSAQQVREMRAAGMEVGGHSRTHVKLVDCPDTVVAEEITGCKVDLEQILGESISSLAYPYGSLNDRCMTAAAHAGFRWACSTHAGFADFDAEPLALRRIAVYAVDDLNAFLGKVLLGRNEADWRKVLEAGLSRVLRRALHGTASIS